MQQDVCQMNLVAMTKLAYESPCSSAARVSDRGHGFNSRWRLGFFLSNPMIVNVKMRKDVFCQFGPEVKSYPISD